MNGLSVTLRRLKGMKGPTDVIPEKAGIHGYSGDWIYRFRGDDIGLRLHLNLTASSMLGY